MLIVSGGGCRLPESVWVCVPDVPCSVPEGRLATIDAKGPGATYLVSAFASVVG
jgi:hypothetical protein